MIEKAFSFGGWPGFILLSLGIVAGLSYWIFLLISGKYNNSLYLLIILFPFTFYAGRAFGLLGYYDDFADFDQRIGLTTFMIMVTCFALYRHGLLKRPAFTQGRKIEYLLWGFAVSVTISQLFTHTFGSALILSIGAAWQYLLIFYLLISLIRDDNELGKLINSLFIFSLINIVVRVVCKGESFIIDLASQNVGEGMTYGAEAGRVGSGALGPAVSYAGYLSIFITLALGAFFITKKKRYLLYIVIIGIELMNTFTRGAIFILFLLGLLFFYKETRPLAYKMAAGSMAVIFLFFNVIWRYLALRGFQLNVFEESNFADRLELIWKFINEYYSFSFFGNGILKDTIIELTPWWSTVVHNAYLGILDTCGVFPFIIFIVITLYSFYTLFKFRAMNMADAEIGDHWQFMKPFLVIAFLQWVVFANTTSTSILEYYPYEGTAVFWIICLSGFILYNIKDFQPEKALPNNLLQRGNTDIGRIFAKER